MTNKYDDILREWHDAELHIRNIVQGGEIERFRFTKGESAALGFALRVISANRSELNDDEGGE